MDSPIRKTSDARSGATSVNDVGVPISRAMLHPAHCAKLSHELA